MAPDDDAADGATETTTGHPLAEALRGALAPQLGAVTISDLRRMTGGASRETWSFDATTDDGAVHRLVLRRDPPGRPTGPGAMAREARVMRAAATAGLPVPEVLLVADRVAEASPQDTVLDPSPWDAAGLVMRRIDGETLARRILREDRYTEARAGLAAECGAALAALHSVDADLVADLPVLDPLRSMRVTLDELGEPVPTFEHALRWLAEHRPPEGDTAVVHGDFRLGNLIVGEDGLRSVLDWELVHPGDPAEDLGWLCVRAWRFGADAPVGGFGSRDQLLDAYRQAGGADVAAATLRWWEVYGTLRWGVICLTQTAVHLRGDLRSVELAAIGRRVCETEWDLLLLLEPEAAAAAHERLAARQADEADLDEFRQHPGGEAGLHGRPTSLELLASVREFLTDQVMVATSGTVSFHARVAANVLAMVERELATGPFRGAARRQALELLGVHGEPGLCSAIREGSVQGTPRELATVLADGVVERVAVANPRYLG